MITNFKTNNFTLVLSGGGAYGIAHLKEKGSGERNRKEIKKYVILSPISPTRECISELDRDISLFCYIA